jgi:hypothetical protein
MPCHLFCRRASAVGFALSGYRPVTGRFLPHGIGGSAVLVVLPVEAEAIRNRLPNPLDILALDQPVAAPRELNLMEDKPVT